MWSARCERLSAGVLRYAVDSGDSPIKFGEAMAGLRHEPAFRAWFGDLLAAAPFSAYRWETPGVTGSTAATISFEFVLVDEPGLARRPNPQAFQEHFRREPGRSVVRFANLGGDAVLVVPAPEMDPQPYGHLAAFVRGAPTAQRDAFWQTVGDALNDRLNSKPVWLSTAGAGVAWLHARLDDRPKYYAHDGYRRAFSP